MGKPKSKELFVRSKSFGSYQQLLEAIHEVLNSLLQVKWVVFGRLNAETKPINTVCYPWATFNNIPKLLLCPKIQNK